MIPSNFFLAAPPVVAEVQKKVYVPPAQRNNFQGKLLI